MSAETLQVTLNFLVQECLTRKSPLLQVTFFGGEPLLEWDLLVEAHQFLIVASQGKFKVRFAINTNGTLFTEERCSYLKEHNFRVYLSLDGTSESHDMHRRSSLGKGSHVEILPWLSKLISLDLVVLKVVTPQTAVSLAQDLQWIHQQGITNFTSAIDYRSPWHSKDWDILIQQYTEFGQYWLKTMKQGTRFYYGTFHDKIRHVLDGTTCKGTTCHIGHGGFAISIQGNLFPCSRFVDDSQKEQHSIGSVFDGFNPKALSELKNYLRNDHLECQACSLKSRCHGNGCACTNLSAHGDYLHPAPQVCHHEKMLTQLADELADSLLQ